MNWKLVGGLFCTILSYSYWYSSKIIYENIDLCSGGIAFGVTQMASFSLALLGIYLLLTCSTKNTEAKK
jgi:hypothetical protein